MILIIPKGLFVLLFCVLRLVGVLKHCYIFTQIWNISRHYCLIFFPALSLFAPSHTLTLTHILIHTYTHIHTVSHTFTHSHILIHADSYTLSYTHSYTNSHTHTHTFFWQTTITYRLHHLKCPKLAHHLLFKNSFPYFPC